MKIMSEDFYYGKAGSVNNQRIGVAGNTLYRTTCLRSSKLSVDIFTFIRSWTLWKRSSLTIALGD